MRESERVDILHNPRAAQQSRSIAGLVADRETRVTEAA
jgi:hypothetical protein